MQQINDILEEILAATGDSAPDLVTVVSFFLHDPKKPRYVQEISRDTGFSLKKIYKLLDKLEELGFIVKIGHPKKIYLKPIIDACQEYRDSNINNFFIERDEIGKKIRNKVDEILINVSVPIGNRKNGMIHGDVPSWLDFLLGDAGEILWMYSQSIIPAFFEEINKLLSLKELDLSQFIDIVVSNHTSLTIIIEESIFEKFLVQISSDLENGNITKDDVKKLSFFFEKIVLCDNIKEIPNFQILDQEELILPLTKPKPDDPELQDFSTIQTAAIIEEFNELFWLKFESGKPLRSYIKEKITTGHVYKTVLESMMGT